MNRLPIDRRAQIIGLLVEGMSMRAVTRITGVSINTVTKLLEDVGLACSLYQAQTLVNLPCKRIQVDEIWSFCYVKQAYVTKEEQEQLGRGDVYTWTGMCADTKLMVSFMVGNRGVDCAHAFTHDLAHRLANRVQLTSDGYRIYLDAVEQAFGSDIDYGMLVKNYGGEGGTPAQRRYSPGEFVGSEKRVIKGNPNPEKISTSFIERQNLTMRMSMRRFTRLTNGFSKKIENTEHAVALHFMHYNFARIHKTLRVTPAMAAGVSDHLWSLHEIAALAE